MRKKILEQEPTQQPIFESGEVNVAEIATALITSEAADHPIEHAFDTHRGPGGTRWVAADPGEQTLILAFDTPQTVRQISVEVEETQVSRTQVLVLSVSIDQGKTYQELRRQEYSFSPSGSTFEREVWSVEIQGMTHLRLSIMPDKGGQPCQASLTSFILKTY